jgi:hypothetical protein
LIYKNIVLISTIFVLSACSLQSIKDIFSPNKENPIPPVPDRRSGDINITLQNTNKLKKGIQKEPCRSCEVYVDSVNNHWNLNK